MLRKLYKPVVSYNNMLNVGLQSTVNPNSDYRKATESVKPYKDSRKNTEVYKP